MKKICLLVLCIAVTLTFLAGCKCDHNYSSVVTREPTTELEGEVLNTCELCGDTFAETVAKLEKHIVPTSVLDNAVSNTKYYSSPFSITIGKLVNSAMENYQLKYLSGEEAIAQGYLNQNDIDASINIDNLYYAIISGDTMVNPSIPYMTEYEEEAVKIWMIFDENDQLVNSRAILCSNLQTCAIIIMTDF